MIASITRGAQEKSWTQSRATLSPFFCALGDDANVGSYDDERDFSMSERRVLWSISACFGRYFEEKALNTAFLSFPDGEIKGRGHCDEKHAGERLVRHVG